MRLTIVVPGKVREPWLRAGIAEYEKRLSRYCAVNWREVADAPDSGSDQTARLREGAAIRAAIKPGAFTVALDLAGKQPDSPELAEQLARWLERGGGSVTFVIGGASGLDPAILAACDARLCLSRMTFTHQMIRLLLLEQCYRAFRIAAGEPYHK